MKPQKASHDLVAPFLALLSKKIRERGFTELEVEETLGWSRDHIRQLKAGCQRLRVQDVLSVLGVLGVEPGEFFAELYAEPPEAEGLGAMLQELSALADGLVNLLIENGLITAGELARATAARAGQELPPDD